MFYEGFCEAPKGVYRKMVFVKIVVLACENVAKHIIGGLKLSIRNQDVHKFEVRPAEFHSGAGLHLSFSHFVRRS